VCFASSCRCCVWERIRHFFAAEQDVKQLIQVVGRA